MSEWIRLTNELKLRSPMEYFTPSQMKVYQCLMDVFHWQGQRANLVGVTGSGKTFVAWALARSFDGKYISHPDDVASFNERNIPLLVIDSAPHYEDQLRRLIAQAGLLGAERTLFITQKPSQLRMQSFELALPTPEDVSHVQRTLKSFNGWQSNPLADVPTLWDILQSFV